MSRPEPKALTEAEWKLISDFLRENFGWEFDGVRRDLLESQLRPRVAALGLHSFLEYYHYLLFHRNRGPEIAVIVDRLTNNETYFFRESHQFRILTDHLVPAIAPTLGNRPIRILSAGCSSGEEPYSIVMSLQEANLTLRGLSWLIDACDINENKIRQAREGVYEDSSLRRCEGPTIEAHFEARRDRHRLKDRHRLGVRFSVANLISDKESFPHEFYDVVFCRNVLIYFGAAAFHATIDLLRKTLLPGGYLCLGHSESLTSVRRDFSPVIFRQGIVYRKDEEARGARKRP